MRIGPICALATVLFGCRTEPPRPISAADPAPALDAAAPVPSPGLGPGAEARDAPLAQRLWRAHDSLGADHRPRTRHLGPDGRPLYINRLVLESSPYLRQHAYNPVDWFPWGEAAFERAKALNRPVLLSVGYSTCHWCHVMERESFEDPEIAAYINRNYVAIKVDREARPDVDATYMTAVQLLTGGGGWPMTVWLTPTGKPFMGGTYFPPRDDSRGSPGLLSLLKRMREAFDRDPSGVAGQAAWLAGQITDLRATPPGDDLPPVSVLKTAFDRFAAEYDAENGGFGGAPKFPQPAVYEFLLRHAHRTQSVDAKTMIAHSLEAMAAGGVYDQLGGGFHRYATDAAWRVPHFEKMLYDNAQLAIVLTEAAQLTGEQDLLRVATEIIGYLDREMSHADGGFVSATDAESGGHEGGFFVWRADEIAAVVGEADAPIVQRYFGVTAEGNFERGASVLRRAASPVELAETTGLPIAKVLSAIGRGRVKLFNARAKRPRPLTDTKVLTGWTGLAISAFARVGRLIDRRAFIDRAAAAAHHVLDRMRPGGRLHRVYADGRVEQPAFVDDHAYVIAGLLDLYEARSEPRWLDEAIALTEAVEVNFRDTDNGGYFFEGRDQPVAIARGRPVEDAALPSSNSTMVHNLQRLHTYTGRAKYREAADAALTAFAPLLGTAPTAAPRLLAALSDRHAKPKEVVIVWADGTPPHRELLAAFGRTYVPSRAFVAGEVSALAAQVDRVPWLEGKVPLDGRCTAYVCEDRVCKKPTAVPEEFAAQLAAELVRPH